VVVAGADEPVDLAAITKIRQEGFRNSEVMDLAWQLSEGIGPRLPASPQHREASAWTKQTLEGWGLQARLDAFDFGRSWAMKRCQVRMVSPYAQPLEALPEAWSPGTNGAIRAKVVRASLDSEQDLEEWAGKLAGSIVALKDAQEMKQVDAELFERWDDEGFAKAAKYEIPEERDQGWRRRMLKRYRFWPKLAAFLDAEGVVATLEPSSRDNGVVRTTGNSFKRQADVPLGVPALTMTTEHYNRLVRMVDRGVAPELELDVEVEFFTEDTETHNTIADLEGSDLAQQTVVLGAHLDSWHTGTGATDNGGNCAVVMEAVRILTAAGLRPRRTIRVALWSGEEQGYLGSRNYIERYLASRPEPTDEEQLALPEFAREPTWPIEPLPGYRTISAYFNLDYGTGRIRGIYAQENFASVPIFEAWLAPFADLGADHLSTRNAGGSDHQAFDWVGIPAFQFMQDERDYMSRTHHSNLDTYDHLTREDLMQSAVILASVVWHAANRDELMPRKPMPRKPKDEE
jgi:hypothetical protein